MNKEVTEIIEKTRLFALCDEDFRKTLAAQSSLIECDKGNILFIKGDFADRFFIILDGWVKLYRETMDGSQAIVDIMTTGHSFGDTAIFEEDKYPYSTEVIEKARIVSLPLALLKSHIETNPKFAMAMMSTMARYRRQQDQELENRTLKNASQRVGCFLLRLIDQSKTGTVELNLPYDKTLVASRLGMQPETFSRALNKLKDSARIKVKGSRITIENVENLADFSCSACSNDYPCFDLKYQAFSD